MEEDNNNIIIKCLTCENASDWYVMCLYKGTFYCAECINEGKHLRGETNVQSKN